MAGLIRAAAAAALLVLAATAARPAWALEGRVTRVTDGDTLWVRPASGARPVKVRLQGLDAPEICQPFGAASRDALAGWVLGRTVRIDEGARDAHGRRLGRLMLGEEDLGARLVREGLAWSPGFRWMPGPYAAEERAARAARRGLFADAGAMPPREFRRTHGPCKGAKASP